MEPRESLQVLLFLYAVLTVNSSSNPIFDYDWLLIDCGASNETTIGAGLTWRTDQEFINSGKNILLAPDQNFNAMNNLRFFPDGYRNCYKLPLYSDTKFIFRAGFFYGNYDGLSKAPSFKLEIDGNLWANVTTSMSQEDPVYHEVIYRTKEKETTVCLVRNSDDEVPFISSLEAKSLAEDIYRLMESKTALCLHSRINYGANKTIEKLIDIFEEFCCNRIWKSKEMTEYLNINAGYMDHGYLFEENYPPWPVMETAIQAKNISDSIYLSVNFSPQAPVEAYFVLYFMDPIFRFPSNESCNFEIYIDNQKLNTVDVPKNGKYKDMHNVASLYPVQVSGLANVTISPANGSTMAPLLNAMEVFCVIDVASKAGAGNLGDFTLPMFFSLLHFVGIFVYFWSKMS